MLNVLDVQGIKAVYGGGGSAKHAMQAHGCQAHGSGARPAVLGGLQHQKRLRRQAIP